MKKIFEKKFREEKETPWSFYSTTKRRVARHTHVTTRVKTGAEKEIEKWRKKKKIKNDEKKKILQNEKGKLASSITNEIRKLRKIQSSPLRREIERERKEKSKKLSPGWKEEIIAVSRANKELHDGKGCAEEIGSKERTGEKEDGTFGFERTVAGEISVRAILFLSPFRRKISALKMDHQR